MVQQLRLILIQLGLSFCLLFFASVVYYFMVFQPSGELIGFYPFNFGIKSLLWSLAGFFIALLIVWCFLTFLPRQKLYDKNVLEFSQSISLWFSLPFFFLNALAEEMLFRGALQYQLGILIATLVFTLVHFSYYKKPFMLLQVFAQGLLLAFLYEMSKSLWICVFCHTGINWLLIYLIKKKYIAYGEN